jgi:hypothetical protein
MLQMTDGRPTDAVRRPRDDEDGWKVGRPKKPRSPRSGRKPSEDEDMVASPPPKQRFAPPSTATWATLNVSAAKAAQKHAQPRSIVFLPREVSELAPNDSRFGSFAGPIPRTRPAVAMSGPIAEFEWLPPPEPPEPDSYSWPLMYRGIPYPIYPVMPQFGDHTTQLDPRHPMPQAFFYPPGYQVHDLYPPAPAQTAAATAENPDTG